MPADERVDIQGADDAPLVFFAVVPDELMGDVARRSQSPLTDRTTGWDRDGDDPGGDAPPLVVADRWSF